MSHDLTAVDRTIDALTARLLACRTGADHWEGRLASSALATATAIIALAVDARASGRNHASLIASGQNWLVAHQNADGGWGDTVLSPSNLSTTALCWAAVALSGGPEGPPLQSTKRRRDVPVVVEADLQVRLNRTVECAERWLRAQIGDVDGVSLRKAILERYGSDRTFSVPILMVLALAGKLGAGADAWRQVPQLPFELAACPHRWFRWMRLPVVSYALPALVAIGQVRHHHAPTPNPLWATLRSRVRSRTLRVTRDMQPESGGYLEAVPLTAFVVMSLIAADRQRDQIVDRGIAFLVGSARLDGSWPIDANLATWVTTLAVRALAPTGALPPPDRRGILRWLLGQQVRREHPFTHAQPGGWGWSHLSGAVPDADDTSGALLALRNLAATGASDAATRGVEWLLAIQNHDGGIPTFCRGWGALPFDRSAPDLTAHALEAWDAWHGAMAPDAQRRIARAAQRTMAYLATQQRPNGSWVPLWFGNQHVAGEVNLTYGTSRVVTALATPLARQASHAADRMYQKGLAWILDAQCGDGGWGGAAQSPPSIEETGLALAAIATAPAGAPPVTEALLRGAAWLVTATGQGRHTPPSPIGLYFARLWYYDELYPLVMSLRGLAVARAALTSTAPG